MPNARAKERLVKGPLALYEQMRQKVMELIEERELRPHDPVPSEGELAELFGVSRRTGKQALEMLAQEGVVYRMPRRGTFLSEAGLTRAKEPAAVQPRAAQPTVLVVVPALDEFVGQIVSAALQTGVTQGWEVLIRITEGDQEREDAALREASQGKAQGVILFPGERRMCGQEVLRLHLQNYPLVIVDRIFREIDLPAVYHDHYQGAYEMTRYLFDRGHRKLGFVSEPFAGIMSREDRYYGFIQAHVDAKIPFKTQSILSELNRADPDAGQLAAYLQSNPELTAIFCSNDLVANLLVNQAERLGRKVPDDLSVAGFTDLAISAMSKVPLTTVAKSPDELGKQAIGLLLREIASGGEARVASVKLPTRIVERGSVRRI